MFVPTAHYFRFTESSARRSFICSLFDRLRHILIFVFLIPFCRRASCAATSWRGKKILHVIQVLQCYPLQCFQGSDVALDGRIQIIPLCAQLSALGEQLALSSSCHYALYPTFPSVDVPVSHHRFYFFLRFDIA